jgi:hypothetical protein
MNAIRHEHFSSSTAGFGGRIATAVVYAVSAAK